MTRRARRWTEDELRGLTAPQLGALKPGIVLSAAVDVVPLEVLMVERARKKAEREKLQNALWWHFESLRICGVFEREARFHPDRKWRLDFLARAYDLGVEIHGGVFANGRHTRGSGFVEDRRKMNAAIALGISVLEYTPEDITTGNAASQVLTILEQRGFRRVA